MNTQHSDTEQHIRSNLHESLADLPRWVETRDLLEYGDFLHYEEQDPGQFVIAASADEFGSVVGRPNLTQIQKAAAMCTEILAFPDNIDHVRQALPDWSAESVRVHIAPEGIKEVSIDNAEYRILNAGEVATFDHLPEDLLQEFKEVDEDSRPICAVFTDATAVAFCYPTSHSETLWDVSVDTLEEHRGNGFAGLAFIGMAELMRKQGLAPQWCAVEGNPASWKVANKLGFQQVDTIWLLTKSAG